MASATGSLRFVCLVLLGIGYAVPGKTETKSEGADGMAAREFDAGKALWKTDPPAACERFRKSMALKANPTVKAWLGRCNERAGLLRAALADFRAALELNRTLNAGRANQAPLQKSIEQDIDALLASATRIDISVSPRPSGLKLWIDGEPLPDWELEDPVLVNRLDVHELVAEAPGFDRAKVTGSGPLSLTLVPSAKPPESAEVVPRAASRASVAVVSQRPAAASTGSAPSDRAPDPGANQRLAGYLVGGAGIVTLGVAGYFGIRTLVLVDQGSDDCYSDGCGEYGYAKMEQATKTQTTGFVVAGAGLAMVGIGTALVFTAPERLDVAVGPQAIRVRGTW